MADMTKKEERLLILAEKGGNDAHLMLSDEMEAHMEMMQKTYERIENAHEELTKRVDEAFEGVIKNEELLNRMLDALTKVEMVKGIPGDQGVQGEKGDKGQKGDSIVGPKGERGEDGKQGIKGEMGLTGSPGKDGKDGKDGSPDTASEIRDKLETLKGNERLDVSAIKGIEDKIGKLERRIGQIPIGGGGQQMRIASFAFAGDDVTTAFILPKTPAAKGLAVFAHYQGQWLQPTTHYTVAGKTFTTVGFTAATGGTIEGFIIYQA